MAVLRCCSQLLSLPVGVDVPCCCLFLHHRPWATASGSHSAAGVVCFTSVCHVLPLPFCGGARCSALCWSAKGGVCGGAAGISSKSEGV